MSENFNQDKMSSWGGKCSTNLTIGTALPATPWTVHIVIVHGDEEIRSVRAFASEEDATACRDGFVRSQWAEWMEEEPMPDDAEEAYDAFATVAGSNGVCVDLRMVEVEP